MDYTTVTAAIIYVPSIIMYRLIEYFSTWTKAKINNLHRNVETKFKYQKKKLNKIVLT